MKAAGGRTVPVTISELASRFWLSRAHVRKVLDLAAADGFIRRTAGSRDPIVVLPALREATDRFFASAFLLARHCIRKAIAAIEAPAG
jgi:DNA-binding GntR family transcriptional regulator